MVTLNSVEKRARRDARQRGIYLTPDAINLNNLIEGIKDNEDRYGYPSCPCRLATGILELDRDIICPCDYRDPDVAEFGSCFCNLYVDQEISKGKKEASSVPERRPTEKQHAVLKLEEELNLGDLKPVNSKKIFYYCKQCGYIVFREEAPYVCPICQAKREMFETIKIRIVS
jgi:ferredoxin-thioredoxin reductase catalytic subunit